MNQASKFRSGSLERVKTAAGYCFYIRFQHTSKDGIVKRPRFRLGLEKDFSSRSAAIRAGRAMADRFNAQPDEVLSEKRRFGAVIERYRNEEMPKRYSTRMGYEGMLRKHIGPRWEREFLADIRPLQVRDWLHRLPLSSRSRGHNHGLMRILFRHAMLWEWIPFGENPMSLFRMEGSTKRQREPQVITMDQFALIVAQIKNNTYRMMVLVAGCTGLRCSELAALQWGDVRFEDLTLRVERAIVHGRVGPVKTIHSAKPLPMDPLLATELLEFRQQAEFTGPLDWVFGSPSLAWKMPYLPRNVQAAALKPAELALGLQFSLGWHTFRHSYKTWLDERDVPLTVQRDLMRHADTRTTSQIYGAVGVNRLRSANSNLVNGLWEGRNESFNKRPLDGQRTK